MINTKAYPSFFFVSVSGVCRPATPVAARLNCYVSTHHSRWSHFLPACEEFPELLFVRRGEGKGGLDKVAHGIVADSIICLLVLVAVTPREPSRSSRKVASYVGGTSADFRNSSLIFERPFYPFVWSCLENFSQISEFIFWMSATFHTQEEMK